MYPLRVIFVFVSETEKCLSTKVLFSPWVSF
jgi:hypothetical protein